MRRLLIFSERWNLAKDIDYSEWTEKYMKIGHKDGIYFIPNYDINDWWDEKGIPKYDDEIEDYLKNR